jgi:hypothetical protein
MFLPLWCEDTNRESVTGEWKPIEGKTYYGRNAQLAGNAFKQEAVSLQ